MDATYLAPAIRMGVQPDCPSLDAARCLGDRIAAAEAQARAQARQMSAGQFAESAIKSIAAVEFTPEVAARLVVILRNRVKEASWSHFEHVDDALGLLDDAHDRLEAV